MTKKELLTAEFRALSARLGQDRLQVQGPGGNTSIKDGEVMWIKASGTELANALTQDIFVPVDCNVVKSEAMGSDKGDCIDAVLEPELGLRPSIETTFHGVLEYPVVIHTHSVMSLVHSISPKGRLALVNKLQGLPFVLVPYVKPGLPLTKEILKWVKPETQIIILQNHGLICCGKSVSEVEQLICTVEQRLYMSQRDVDTSLPQKQPNSEFKWSEYGWLAKDPHTFLLAINGSYYPDHVVFLGPALPQCDHEGKPPVIIEKDKGILIRKSALPSHKAMLCCLAEILQRLPHDWIPEPIGEEAEAELLNWDAEKYRQELAKRK